MFKGHQNRKLRRSRDRLTTFVRDCKCISTLAPPEKTCKQPEQGRTTRVNVFIIFSQVRAICVQIAYHSKLEVSSLSGDFKDAHRSPAEINEKTIQKNPCEYKGHTHTEMDCVHCMCMYIYIYHQGTPSPEASTRWHDAKDHLLEARPALRAWPIGVPRIFRKKQETYKLLTWVKNT